jgi:hypothetical protein
VLLVLAGFMRVPEVVGGDAVRADTAAGDVACAVARFADASSAVAPSADTPSADTPPAVSRSAAALAPTARWVRFWFDMSVRDVGDLWTAGGDAPRLFRVDYREPVVTPYPTGAQVLAWQPIDGMRDVWGNARMRTSQRSARPSARRSRAFWRNRSRARCVHERANADGPAMIDGERMNGRLGVMMTIACVLQAAGAPRARAPARRLPSGSAGKPVCVDAEVDGKRALSYDCLSRQLKPASDATGRRTADRCRTAVEAAVEPPRHVQPVDRTQPLRLELGPLGDAAAARRAGRGAAEAMIARDRRPARSDAMRMRMKAGRATPCER